MDSLEFNLHQLILSDLARTVSCPTTGWHTSTSSTEEGKKSVDSAIQALSSRVETRVKSPQNEIADVTGDSSPDNDQNPIEKPEDDSSSEEGDECEPRVFMSASRVHCNIAFGEMASNIPPEHSAKSCAVLIEILKDIPYIDFEHSLVWEDWALPDQLVFSTVSALLRIAESYSEHRSNVMEALRNFSLKVMNQLDSESPDEVITRVAPCFHGLYRAVISTPFPWHIREWQALATKVEGVFTPHLVDRLNSLLTEYLEVAAEDIIHHQDRNGRAEPAGGDDVEELTPDARTRPSQAFVSSLVLRYAAAERPLSGYFLVCSLTEIQWVLLGQVLAPPLSVYTSPEASPASPDTPQTTGPVFSSLQAKTLRECEGLEGEAEAANEAWGNLIRQPIEPLFESSNSEMEGEHVAPSRTIEEELELDAAKQALNSTLTSAMQTFEDLLVQIEEMDVEPSMETYAYETMAESLKLASLCCIALGDLDSGLFSRLKLLLSDSSPVYENLVQEAALSAATALVHNFPEIASSLTLHLRRFVTAPLPIFQLEYPTHIRATPPLTAAAKCLALCIKVAPGDDLVMSNMYSLLNYIAATSKELSNPNTTPVIGHSPYAFDQLGINSVETGLRVFDEDQRRLIGMSTISVVTQLALEFEEEEVTKLTVSMLLQRVRSAGPDVEAAIAYNLVDLALAAPPKLPAEIDELGGLVLPIDALVSHKDFKLHILSPPELVQLFRNFWLLCVLFRFTSADSPVINEWQKAALARIAAKTPPIILETSQDFVTSELEYNPVLRQDYLQMAVAHHRSRLNDLLPMRLGDIRYLSPGQIIFILTLYDVEVLRSSMDLPASLPTYFVNDGLNKSGALAGCMDAIAENVIRSYIGLLSRKIVDHSLSKELSKELRQLLVTSCHRVTKTRDVASKYINRLITSFPSLMCDEALVCAILEVLTLLRKACEGEFTDEYSPQPEFISERAGIKLQLTDNYRTRNEMLASLTKSAESWFNLAILRAPIELQVILQSYLGAHETVVVPEAMELGATIALKFATTPGPLERKAAPISGLAAWKPDLTKLFASQVAAKNHYDGEVDGIRLAGSKATDKLQKPPPLGIARSDMDNLRSLLARALSQISDKTSNLSIQELKRLLFRCASILASAEKCDYDLLHYLVALPFEIFSPLSISLGIETWTWLIRERPDCEISLMLEINSAWAGTIRKHKGVFSKHLNTHPLAREVRFSLLLFGFEALRSSRMDTFLEYSIREALYRAAFSWFAVRPQWSFGANRVQIDADVKLLNAFLDAVQQDGVRADHLTTSMTAERHASRGSARQKSLNNLLRLLVENEIVRLNVWSNPTNDFRRGPDHVLAAERSFLDDSWYQVVRTAWRIDPAIAVHMAERFKAPSVSLEVNRLVRANPDEVSHVPEALRSFLGDRLSPIIVPELKHLLYWAPVPPVIAVGFFGPNYANNPIVLQYAHRVLVEHPVNLTFFFVPQVVQALRNDALGPSCSNKFQGYVERFIFETAKISQLFCHQIIWNMKANCYKDDAGEIEDPMKPMLDRMVDMVVASLSGEAREFYDREFDFFNEVTSISGKLKPFIKKTKPEKKAKIDEEMEKIVVDPGVYLPSNPDGVVVDIDKKSGRPLQSHAKAPFMATFKVRKQRVEVISDPEKVLDDSGEAGARITNYDVWQAAIFKVGDDCRQDVLALQIIAMFKNIFSGLGLMLYLFPYRVTATAPGCGVIDVVPNATSRDEMGRAKINDLLAFFVARYGSPDTVEFQKARLNFIQSMAAYSVACYILQIKDRHNGNIMIDAHGHIVHIGELFAPHSANPRPGGVKFEPSSFKLTHEMVVLMGGRESQGYALFVQLTVKAFLAIRPHTEQLVQTVALMLGTGFPSFKGEPTIKRLRDRFAPGVTERQAADFMMAIIKNAHENMRSTVYDEFQRLQNGIPYA
ncbi:phosphatidylinositol-4- kinase [Tulasnella sp. 427]|nr:phosphatidylinositol-4- kinase [Tulasnella sp. 427]